MEEQPNPANEKHLKSRHERKKPDLIPSPSTKQIRKKNKFEKIMHAQNGKPMKRKENRKKRKRKRKQ